MTDATSFSRVATPAGASPLRTAVSHRSDPVEAVAELASELCHASLGFVLFFCSVEYPLESLSRALNEVFDDIPVVGCTSAGEITPAGYARGSIVAIGFDCRHFELAPALVESLYTFDLPCAQRLVDDLLGRCRERALAPLADNSFVLTLLDGLSSSEESVIATLDAALGSIPSFGGSAGDDNRLARTHVFCHGSFHTEAAVVLMVNTPLPFEVFTTHHLRPRHEKLVVTAVDRESRRVLELNAAPAVEAYAALVGQPVARLGPELFARHPLAVRIGDHYYVRSIQRANEDGSLSFYCAVENGIVLTAMASTPIHGELVQTLRGLEQRLGPHELVIGCDCFLRRLELEVLGEDEAVSDLLSRSRVIGFNTYGEQYHGIHINQTFTGVAIGAARSGGAT